MLSIPHPGLGVNGLAHRSQQPYAGDIIILGPFLAGLHEHPDGRRCGVEDGDLVVLDDLEKPTKVRVVRSALIHHACCTEAERSINYVGVACDPSDIGCAPPDISVLDIEDPMQSLSRSHAVSAVDVLDTLGFAGSAGGVKDEQPILRVHLLALAFFGLSSHQVVPVDVSALLHGHFKSCPLDHYYIFHRWGIGGGLVHIRLEGEGLAAPV